MSNRQPSTQQLRQQPQQQQRQQVQQVQQPRTAVNQQQVGTAGAAGQSSGQPSAAVNMDAAIRIPREIVQSFEREVQALQHDALATETRSNSAGEIAEKQFALFKLYSSFLNSIRSHVYRNVVASDNPILIDVSVADLEQYERARQLALYRMIIARNADTVGLGNEFLNSVNPDALQKRVTDSLRQLSAKGSTAGGSSGDDTDDGANEEKNPQAVNLDNSGGLYTIYGTEDAIDLRALIGYQVEADRLVSYCRRVVWTGANGGSDTSASNRNPVVIILSGPPGTGKTTIAQSVAKYLDTVYMYVNAETVVSQWAGGTEKNIAKLFRRARIASVKYASDPSRPRRVLMLIDEVDGLIKKRTSANISPEVYGRITTFLQMLTPPVGVNNSNLIVVFTTNRLENLDDAIVNRAKGQIFMGYIVKPADRLVLMERLFGPYSRQPLGDNVQFQTVSFYADDLVPRDLQNIVVRLRTDILAAQTNASSAQDELRIDLSLPANRLNVDEIVRVLNSWRPATPARTLFADYNPPLEHVCYWLASNRLGNNVSRSFGEYAEHGANC